MRSRLKQTGFFLLLTTIVFLVLYRRFLFGSAVYLYTDIGSDSISSSYPILVMLSRLFQNGDFSFYTLSSGLGADTTVTFLQYLNPLKAFLLLFSRNSMPIGILLQLYLQTLLTAWASYRFFDLYTGHSAASMGAALLFSYSSYAVLWSQNLSYGVCVAMFALTMFALEAFLRLRTLPRFLALTGVLALYLFTNYFFCYMTALFVIIYIPLRAVSLKESLRSFVRQFVFTGLSALSALLMSAVAVAAILGSFLTSVRTEDASRSLLPLIQRGIDPKMFFACLSRLFSENFSGIGDRYQGPDNYYEIAALAVGALFFFACFYLLWQKKMRLKVLLVAALCVLGLLLPAARYLLNMNWLVMRFSFWICLLECLAVSLFLKALFTGPDPKALRFSVIGAVCCCAVSLAVLFLNEVRGGAAVSRRELLFFLVFLFAYVCVIFFLWIRPLPLKILEAGPRREHVLAGALLLVMAAEILVMRHDTLYLRLYLTKEQFGSSAYNDGVQQAVSDIQEADRDLYRIASTDNYFYANEGLVDGFNATSLYNNTNPASLRTLALAHGTNEVSTPYFMSGYPEYGQFTLLAGRYLIRREETGAPITEPALCERVSSYPTSDEGWELVVYRNKNALPFGYLLPNPLSAKDYEDSDLVTRMDLLTDHYFLTDGEENADAGESAAGEEAVLSPTSDTRRPLTKCAVWKDPHNLEMKETEKGITFTATGDDPYIYVYLDPEGETEGTSNYLYMKVNAKNKNTLRNIALYYLGSEEAVPTQDWVETIFYNKYYPESLTLLPDGIAGFRFDIDDNVESVTLSSLDLVTCLDPLEHFRELAATDIRNITFDRDLYSADLTAPEGGVLCVPLLYTSGWSASVNGENAEVLNVNGGLIGIPVGEGESHVELRYRVPHFTLGLIITFLSCGAYLAAWILVLVRRRKLKQ